MRIAILDDYQNVALRESGDVTPHPVRHGWIPFDDCRFAAARCQSSWTGSTMAYRIDVSHHRHTWWRRSSVFAEHRTAAHL
jgi:hypothetical protein